MKVVTDRFDVEHEIGHGGMGTVFRARDREDGRVVALKVLRRGTSGDSLRFDREARVLADLTHPAIVRYVAHGLTARGDPYLAMEWLEGEDLATYLRRGQLSPYDTVRLGSRVAGALGAAHSQGVVHRDIKPSNLFLPGGDLERVKLLDFGVARWSRAAQAPTVTGTVLGTPAYMPPEQARGDKRLGPEADVFSLGCVLFECLTGKPPYAGDNLMETLSKLVLGDPPHLKDFRNDVPPAIADAVEQMMDKAPKRRPPNGDAVKRILDDLDSGRPSVVRLRGDAAPNAPAMSAKAPEAAGKERPRSGVVAASRIDRSLVSSSKRAPRPKASGFATAVDAASRKPEATDTLSDKVVVILSKYIPMPWAMLKAQCQRLRLDPARLDTGDIGPLTEALVAAASRLTGPTERAALRTDLQNLEEDR